MDWLRYDVRQALRGFRARPGLAAVMIGTLALGLGVNAVAFSAFDALFFASHRLPNARDAGWIFAGTRGNPLASSSLETLRHVETNARTLRDVAAEGRRPLAVRHPGAGIEQAFALVVSERYFSVLPVTPAAGRLLGPADATTPGLTAMISERYWRDRFDAAPDLASLALTVSRQPAVIVGVMPDDFQSPGGLYAPDLWLPLAAAARLIEPGAVPDPSARWLTLFGRPRDGQNLASVEGELRALMAGLPNTGAPDDPLAVRYVPFVDGHPELSEALPALFAAVLISMSLLLLVACFNIAGLTLARAAERRQDFALRAAIGASPGRLIRAMVTESFLLALAAGLAAILVVQWSEQLLAFFAVPAPIPQRLRFVVGGRLLAVMSALTAFATLLPILVPAWQVRRGNLAASARGQSHASTGLLGQRPRRLFVRLQVGGSMLFVALGLLVIRSFAYAVAFEPGLNTDDVVLLQVTPALGGHGDDDARRIVDELTARIGASPAIAAVAVANRVPFYVGYPDRRGISTEMNPCTPPACPTAVTYAVTGSYFDAMGIRLLAGRAFDDRTAEDADAVVINETAARTFWPDGSALGQRFREGDGGRVRQVTGIVSDFTHRGVSEPPQACFFTPLTTDERAQPVTIVARAAGPAEGAKPVLLEAMRGVDPDLPPTSVQTMRERMALPLWTSRVTAGFFGLCGLLAITLATVGLFGTTWYAVSRRTREFGVRMAVGAGVADIRRLVIGEGLRLALPALAAGLLLTVGIAVLGRRMLVGTSPVDPLALGIAVIVQVSAVVLANWWPARRASRVDPLRALSAE